MSNPSIAADKTPWYQWDTGLTVTVSGGEMNECHFANRKQGTAYVQAVINGVARVPDELLQVAAPIKAYGYVSDGAGGQTYIEETFEVIARNIPADYTYTKTAQKTIRDAEAARDEAVQASKDAKASELAADDSAVESSTSAQSAGESASAAATSASNAAKSAGDAAKSESEAKAAAGKAVEDASALLKTYIDNAKTSADNAATSASNAADAASAASGSASAAEQSATDASNAKVAAETAKDEAATSASNAATSASNAESSATAAEKSASDAAASVGAINVIAPKHVSEAAYAPSFEYGFAAARGSKAYGGGIAIGVNATSGNEEETVSYPVSIGAFSKVLHTRSVAIGAYSETSKPYEVSVGRSDVTREITNISTPTTPTSASTKKYTDDNDAKTLTEAKKYTDDNTSNALVGKVSGKLLHVEDAWPGKPLGLTIDGAYKQDGTPSPENPVPIQVIENPVLQVTGRNLLDTEPLNDIANFDTSYHAHGFYVYKLTLPAVGDYTVSVGKTNKSKLYLATATTANPNTSEKTWFSHPNVGLSAKVTYKNVDVIYILFSDSIDKVAQVLDAVGYLQVEAGAQATAHALYVSTSTPFTLPAEHPYLAKLPDGTADEVSIDAEGNVTLVARVGRDTNVRNVVQAVVGKYYELRTKIPAFASASAMTSDSALCSAIQSKNSASGLGIYRTWTGVYVRDNSVGTTEEIQAEINKAAPLTVFAPIPETSYQLGKVTVPSLPDTISNVWTDAELTTNMSMTYKRDINIAFENLTQAVVAAAAGE